MNEKKNELAELLKALGVRIERHRHITAFFIPQHDASGYVLKKTISAAINLIIETLISEVATRTAVEIALKALQEEENIEWNQKQEIISIARKRHLASVKEVARGIAAFMQDKKLWRGRASEIHFWMMKQKKMFDWTLVPRCVDDFEDLFYECQLELVYAGVRGWMPPDAEFEFGHVTPKIRPQKPN